MSCNVISSPLWALATVLMLTSPLSATAQDAEGGTPAPAVTVVPASMKTLADSETFSGRIEAQDRVDLLARVPGFIEGIGFTDGARVAAGTVLVEIEPDSYEAAITQIQGQIESAKAEKTLADIEVDRQQQLFDKGDVALTVLQQAQADQGKIDGQLLQLDGSLKAAQLNLSYTKIAAPFEGRIGLTDLAVGAYVGPETGPLATLASIDPIDVVFPVSEAQLLDFRAASQSSSQNTSLSLRLTLANGETYPLDGAASTIDTEVQSGTDTVLVRGTFGNPDGHLLDGQLVRVSVIAESDAPVLVVPTVALQRDKDGFFVLTVGDDSVVARTPVTVARTVGSDAVVSAGLAEGARVITVGAQRAKVGAMVDAQPPETTATATE
ncbi:efflux RND transporter periplasmic adaptor subunit [Tropicimonas marinistellae]|uniref:efflux RND transporter periplasmic adaptor subunit n=1 Tax=Tropicimonas marinistellae TaxID=1739787 RepID=UPI0013732468|nr:efflux RND transporter periplasmic adaptor subunit [Tropicimonas marinistellae]